MPAGVAPSGAMMRGDVQPIVYQLRVTLKYIDPPIWRRLHHGDYEHLTEWLGARFDPERIDCDVVNRRLAKLSQ